MGKFKVEIMTGDDEMQTPEDLAEVLREIAEQVATASKGGIVVDRNGNMVGRFRLVGEWPD